MAFSDFAYPDVVTTFGLTERGIPKLFDSIPEVASSQLLRQYLAAYQPLATTAHSEAARSMWLASPVLGDLWTRYQGEISLIPGVDFNADPSAGLNGRCDFVICRGPQRSMIGFPVLLIFEAKRDSIPDGLGQCIAGMVGAQRHNRRNKNPIDPLYGCVTTGTNWKFLRLSGTNLTQDLTEYNLSQVDRILGIMIHMIGPVPQPAAA